MDEAVLAGVPSGGDGRVMGGAGRLHVAVLGGKGAGVFRRGGGLLLGAFHVEIWLLHHINMITCYYIGVGGKELSYLCEPSVDLAP